MEASTVKDEDDVPDAAERLVEELNLEKPEVPGKPRIVAFYGPMGAGKTTLIRAVCERLGVTDTVNSPTFAIVNEYCTEAGRRIYHFDFYRVERMEEVFDFGYEEYFYSGELCLIEWPEKVEEILPEEGVTRVRIGVDGETRTIRVVG